MDLRKKKMDLKNGVCTQMLAAKTQSKICSKSDGQCKS